MKRQRLLFLYTYFWAADPTRTERLELLSREYSGDIVAAVGKKDDRHRVIGAFTLHGLYLPVFVRQFRMLQNVLYAIYTVCMSLYLHWFKKRYDVIVAYDPLVSGFFSIALGKLTGAKVVVEVNNNFEKALKYEPNNAGYNSRLKFRIGVCIVQFVLNRADRVKLLYPGQLDCFKGLKKDLKTSVFHAFVPLWNCSPGEDKKYILFLGYPWFLKGVDVLIKAFKRIHSKYPEHALKVVGYCLDRSGYEQLAEGNPKIELLKPVYHPEAMKLMSECSLFVLPSRTEAMGRAILEAMASRKPIVASNVDGIPSFIMNGETGLLFESENDEDLALKMESVLGNVELAGRLAGNGYAYVHERLSEERFFECYKQMIEETLGPGR